MPGVTKCNFRRCFDAGWTQDKQLIATEIRVRAEMRAGELLAKMPKATSSPGNQHTGPVPKKNQSTPTLSDLKVTKKQSSQWQRLAATL